MIENAFNNQTVNSSTSALVATATAKPSGPAAVPEPAAMAVLIAAAAVTARCSRRGAFPD